MSSPLQVHRRRAPRAVGVLALLSTLSGLAPALPQTLPAGHDVHVMNRVGYGVSPADAVDIAALGESGWVEFNLGPQSQASNPRLEALSSLYPDPGPYGYSNGNNTVNKLSQRELAYALYSDQPLREQMVDFWRNHFSTDYTNVEGTFRRGYGVQTSGEHAVFFLRRDQDFFREHGLGSFEDLLLHSARSVPMLFYLDAAASEASNPNENYAREVMELHTLGEGQLYDEDDVAEAAKLFTCWEVSLIAADPEPLDPDVAPLESTPTDFHALHLVGDIDRNGVIELTDHLILLANWGQACSLPECGDLDGDGTVGFGDLVIFQAHWGERVVHVGHVYNPLDYFPGDKSFFGDDLEIDEGTTADERYAEATTFLRYLANREETARFISSKLIAKFVADVSHSPDAVWPPNLTALREDCVDTWEATGGNIEAVLRTIFTSKAFTKTVGLRWSKPQTPLESAVAAIRRVDHESRSTGLVTTADQLETVRLVIKRDAFHELFREKLPTGNTENNETSTASLLGNIEFLVSAYSTGPEGFAPPWSAHFPGLSASSPELPEAALDLLYGPEGHGALDLLFAQQEHQFALAEGINTLDDMCARLMPFLASLPQGFLQ